MEVETKQPLSDASRWLLAVSGAGHPERTRRGLGKERRIHKAIDGVCCCDGVLDTACWRHEPELWAGVNFAIGAGGREEKARANARDAPNRGRAGRVLTAVGLRLVGSRVECLLMANDITPRFGGVDSALRLGSWCWRRG